MQKIDQVSSKGNIIRINKEIKESEIYEFQISKNDRILLDIDCYGKFNPMKVKVEKTGKVKIFVSSKNKEPDEENCERVFICNNFKISDGGFRFKALKLFFTILAFEDVVLKFSYEFNKRDLLKGSIGEKLLFLKSKNEQHIRTMRENPSLKAEFVASVNEILAKRKDEAQKLCGYKDFVEINRSAKSLEERKGMIKSRSEERVKRAESAKDKKRINYSEKVEKAKFCLIKRDLKKQERLKKEAEQKLIEEKKIQIQHWARIISFSLIYLHWWSSYRLLRASRSRARKSAAKIQRIYRRWTSTTFLGAPKELIRSHNCILIFKLFFRPVAFYYKHQIMNLINSRVGEIKPKKVFKKFFSKIIFLQKSIREFVNIRQFLFDRSIVLWKSTISKVIKRVTTEKKNINLLNSLIRIRETYRDAIVKDHLKLKYHNKRVTWANYKSFLLNKNELQYLIKKATRLTSSSMH
ncbi:hypothetical protein SteCoe_5943 [Stentor coeruleus]|uniref:Uncharacterized protein n=1 Tax=Stentor coeruleus TaxID=5963 RepID=A0A1R2CR39_9CILI|nr:hypothetical protein SteCoe_5943 [Stentor coeruleus]